MPNKKRISKTLTVKDEKVSTRNSRGVSKKLTQAVSETKMRMASKKLPQVVSDSGFRYLKKLYHKKPA